MGMGGDGDGPAFGYGHGGRPLWTERDRDAERIREVLRTAGCVEFSDDNDGFVVEGGSGGAPFMVACTGRELAASGEVAAYATALTAAGWFSVEPDPEDSQSLQVRIVDVGSAAPQLRPTYDSVAAYNKAAPGQELPGDTDDIQHVFHNAIDDGRIEFCLDFAPRGLAADPDTIGNLTLRPWNGDGPIIVLAAGITRKQVNELILLSPRPHTLKRLRAELENLGFAAP